MVNKHLNQLGHIYPTAFIILECLDRNIMSNSDPVASLQVKWVRTLVGITQGTGC